MKAILLAQGADLVQETAALIGDTEPSKVLVVFPGKRPGHFLRRALARTRGSGFIPPRILSMDELVHTLYEERTGGTRPLMEDIDAVAILHGIQASSSSPLGGSAFMSLDGFFSLGMRIFSDLEELLIEGVDGAKVAEVQPLIEEQVPLSSRERLAELARFYQGFYPEAERLSLSTRSSRFRAIAETLSEADAAPWEKVILSGFFSLSRAEAEILRKMAGWEKTRLLFQDGPGMAEKLKGLGIMHPVLSGVEPPPAKTFFASSPDTHGQIFALTAALSSVEEGTAVVLPAPESLFPLIRHCLSRFPEQDYNVSLGYPLDRTPLFGLFADLMTLITSMDGERVYVPDYLTFMLHPYIKNIRSHGSAEATRVLVHAIEGKLSSLRTRVFVPLSEIESDQALFSAAAAAVGGSAAAGAPPAAAEDLAAHLKEMHDRTIRAFRAFSSVGEFAQKCISLIEWVHGQSTAPAHPFFTRFSEELIRALESISRSLLADKRFSGVSGYFLVFKRYLKTRYLPFPGTPLRGLQVLGAMETRCLRFSRVFVIDANEGSLPPAGGDDSLLPFAVRRALGLQTHREREEAALYHFTQLSRGAAEMHLFSVESGERQRSRFMESLIWEREKELGRQDRGLVRHIQYRVSLSNSLPRAVEKTPEVAAWLRERELSATALDAYLRCPLSFYYKTVLGLSEREQPTGEFEHTDIGRFVHEALRLYFLPRTGRALTQADVDRDGMHAVVSELFRKRFGGEEGGAARLLARQLRSHLGDFLTGWLAPQIAHGGVEISRMEQDISVVWNGFRLRGKIDAVLTGAGFVRVIDYKTSSFEANYRIRLDRVDPEDRTSWADAIPTLQLPFYLALEPSASQAAFLLLGKSRIDPDIEIPLFTDGTEAAWELPRLHEVMRRLLEEITSPDVPFTSAEDTKTACPSCAFMTLCGTRWRA